MSLLTSKTLHELAQVEDNCLVSLFAPMQRAGREVRQNEIRWKNLIKEARRELAAANCDSAVDEILQPAEARLGETEFWQQQSSGLACFCSRNHSLEVHSPLEFEQSVTVGSRYHLLPLLRAVPYELPWYVLAVSANQVRLFRFFLDEAGQVEPESMPSDLRSALDIDEYVSSLQTHVASRSGRPSSQTVLHHGHGGSNMDVRKRDELMQFFRILARPVEQYLARERSLLIFAGVDWLFPLFREACQYPHLCDDSIAGNPDELSASQLRERAQPIIDAQIGEQQLQLVRKYEQRAGSDWSSTEIAEILVAARQGQVDSLLIAGNGNNDHGNPEYSQQLNESVIETLRNSGHCAEIPARNMPERVTVAALFRSPVAMPAGNSH